MTLKQKLLSSLFSLFAGTALLPQSSKAATCSWDVLLAGGSTIQETCAMKVDSSGLTWNTVTYFCSPARGPASFNFVDFSFSLTPGLLTQSNHTVGWSGLAPGKHDCVAFGGDSSGAWSESTGDTYVTL